MVSVFIKAAWNAGKSTTNENKTENYVHSMRRLGRMLKNFLIHKYRFIRL
jgi:hypothetical protein